MARPPPGRAGPPLEIPPRQDRPPLEVLDGYLIVYLNIDKVIKIIRENEPKPALMKAFELTDVQAEAILNMRLRACASSRRWRSSASTMSLTRSAKS